MHPATQVSKTVLTSGEQYKERPFSYTHHQLRDLVHCSEDANVLYGTCGTQTIRYDCQKAESSVVQDLNFTPTSMTHRHGYVAVGGLRSELEVKRIVDDTTIFKGRLQADLNNSLHIARDCEGNTNLYIGNNDSTIKVYSLPDMQPSTSIPCTTRINYTSLSPDGQYLVAVGDCHSVFVYKATPTRYELVQQYTEARGDGMCCSWNSTGTCYAASYQDGTTVVIDFASSDVIAKYKTEMPCYNVKFSRQGVDVMAYAENRKSGMQVNPPCRVHLVDTRRWDQQQTHSMRRGELAGMSFAPNGSRLYVGQSEGTTALEIDTAARRVFCTGSHL